MNLLTENNYIKQKNTRNNTTYKVLAKTSFNAWKKSINTIL